MVWGALVTIIRAKIHLDALLKTNQPPNIPAEQVAELKGMVAGLASDAGLEKLPVFNIE